jgi:hypothetical protein
MTMPKLTVIIPSIPNNFFQPRILKDWFEGIEGLRIGDYIYQVNLVFYSKLDKAKFAADSAQVAAFAVEKDGMIRSF